MATVCCRALYAVRWYEVSRVLSVSSTLVTTKNYRNDTWCKRWWYTSQRNLFLTTSRFAPGLSPVLAKEEESSKAKAVPAATQGPSDVSKLKDATLAPGVTVTYHRGLPKITVPLPSRQELCAFTLKPITHTVGDFLHLLKKEDRGIDRAVVMTMDGVKISSNNTVESLLEDDFRLILNNQEYLVSPPLRQKLTMESMEKLSDVQMLICQLYEAFHVREYHADMEKQVLAELEVVRLELQPFEQQLLELETKAARRSDIFGYCLLIVFSVHLGGLARLTWWEYSWDIMEPITFFVTFGSSLILVAYYLLTKEEYLLPGVLNRRQLIILHKTARKIGFDINRYNSLKDRAYELETTLKLIRGPLYNYRAEFERKKRERSRSSSSSSRSPSSSPSPSPSPERSLPKKGIFPGRDASKKAVSEETRLSPAWTHKETRDY